MQRPKPAPHVSEAEREPVLPAVPEETSTPFPPIPPASPGEPPKVLERAFGAVLIPREDSGVFAGDFNGDGSQDLALVVRPVATKLDEINSEFSNWIVQDALAAPPSAAAPQPATPPRLVSRPTRPQVLEDDELLAVIHGYGAPGWRNPEARQAYLLRNAVGQTMEVKHIEEATGGGQRRFDVLVGTWREGSGVVRWTGARYRRILIR